MLKKTLFFLFKVGFIFGFLIIIFILGIFIYFSKDLPNPQKLNERQIIQSTKIFARDEKTLLYEIHGEEKRTVIPLDLIPQYTKQAIIAIEDANFYNHIGIDLKSIIRAAWVNYKGKKIIQGASTITQQLIKNSILTRERTFTRKIKEIILALELERKYSKDQILEMYLNQVSFGSNAYGIEAASQTFFNKPASNLSLAESAALAALIKAPSYYSPKGTHFNELIERKNYILDRMVELNFITKEEAEKAKTEVLNFSKIKTDIKAPHFVMFIKEYLEEKYGANYIASAGLKVITTLDPNLQKLAEEIVLKWSKINETQYQAKNSALVAIDPKTGQILVMVGSRDYNDETIDGNFNVATGFRQPGSAFKPFVYAAAFKKGYTPDTIVFDLPTEFSTSYPDICPPIVDFNNTDDRCYHPKNYDEKFRGPVTFRQALAQSLNVPSVKVLYLTGLDNAINLAEDLGITTLKNRKRFGLSLVLGGGEVKLLEITSAYGVFANDGKKNPISAILKIKDSNNNILEEWKPQEIEVLNPQIARLINDILSDNEARTPIFGASSPLYFPKYQVAAKTGTTQDYKDAWVIGYTPQISVGVWVGNNDNTPMTKGGAGIMAAGPIWHEFLENVFKRQEEQNIAIEQFIPPEKIETSKSILNGKFENERIIKIDKISGLLATDMTPPQLIEEKIYKEVHNILYYINKDEPLDPSSNSKNDPQFNNWETPVLQWVSTKNIEGFNFNQTPPTQFDNIHTKENQPKVEFINIFNGSEISGDYFDVKISTLTPLGIKQIDYFVDDKFVGSLNKEPFVFTLNLNNFSKEKHSLMVKIYDKAENTAENKIEFYIK